jgi:hypothetical protein
VIEAGVQLAIRPTFWDKTTWLLHDPYRGELFDRLIVEEKIRQLEPLKPDIISVGDSSGFFSIQPNIVNRYLHGLKYASLSTGANQAFEGYKAIMLYMIEHQPSIRYVVLNMHPTLIPSPEVLRKADLGPILYDDLVGIKSKVTPPSAALSPYAKSLLFYHTRYDPNALPSSHKVFLEVHYTLKDTLGWVPEHDTRRDRTVTTTPLYPDRERHMGNLYGLLEGSAILTKLQEFADICRAHHVRLMIMFNPMGWAGIQYTDDLFKAEQLLETFQHNNPDVVFLTDHLITPWDTIKFGMFNHIARDYVFEGSARMGMAIEKALFKPELVRPFHMQWNPRKYPKAENIKVISPATDEQIDTALAFYFYTATQDKRYWDAMSDRVHRLLGENVPFNWMMEDMKTRTRQLAEKKITLSYDRSQIKGNVISQTGTYYCGDSKDVTWIRLGGVMSFGYKSPVQESSEPVKWSMDADVIIPLIRENGRYVFDGYCPANLETFGDL